MHDSQLICIFFFSLFQRRLAEQKLFSHFRLSRLIKLYLLADDTSSQRPFSNSHPSYGCVHLPAPRRCQEKQNVFIWSPKSVTDLRCFCINTLLFLRTSAQIDHVRHIVGGISLMWLKEKKNKTDNSTTARIFVCFFSSQECCQGHKGGRQVLC